MPVKSKVSRLSVLELLVEKEMTTREIAAALKKTLWDTENAITHLRREKRIEVARHEYIVLSGRPYRINVWRRKVDTCS